MFVLEPLHRPNSVLFGQGHHCTARRHPSRIRNTGTRASSQEFILANAKLSERDCPPKCPFLGQPDAPLSQYEPMPSLCLHMFAPRLKHRVRLNRRLHTNLIKLRNTVDISSKRIRSLDKANRRMPKPPKGLAKAWVLLN